VPSQIIMHADGFDLFAGEICVLSHRTHAPAFAIGIGTPDMEMVRGTFGDDLHLRLPLDCFANDKGAIRLWSSDRPDSILGIKVDVDARKLALRIRCTDDAINRLWIDMRSENGEAFWGGGEQMSYLRLNGRRFPFWTSEPGVGRDKSTKLTQTMDAEGLAGGDYWTTNYPQPTWLSSHNYAVHLDTAAYSVLDLTDGSRAGIECWKADLNLELFTASGRTELVRQMSDRFGRQPPLPDWAISGAIVGLKDGQDTFARFEEIAASGAALTGLWCEDWIGIRQTSFGKRLFWDWQWNATRYPDLPDRIAALAERGVRFLGYVNPYLAVDGPLFAEAAALGYLA
jgi:alpha-glucosidase